MTPFQRRRGTGALQLGRFACVIPVVLSAWRFFPITRNYFFGDDLYQLYQAINRPPLEYFLEPYGNHLLITRNFLFWACYQLFGTEVQWYFWLVLLTHLANVLLLYRVLARFTGNGALASFGATLWGASPINEGALGWYSVYGQVLTATIMLWLLDRLGRAASGVRPTPRALAGWAVLLLVASTSFGTGIGITVAFPLLVLLLLPPSVERRRAVVVAAMTGVIVFILYVAAHRLVDAPDSMAGRQLQFAFANVFRWQALATLTSKLTVYGFVNLMAGPLYYPVKALVRWSTPLFVLLMTAVAAGLWRSPASARRVAIACMMLCLACYGIIAAGRVTFLQQAEMTLITAARYHYAAPLPMCIAVFVLLAALSTRFLSPRWERRAAGAALAILVLTTVSIRHPIDHHDNERRMVLKAVSELRERILAAPAGSEVRIENRAFAGVGPFMMQRLELFPGLAGVFAVFFPDPIVEGRRVRFVISEPKALAAAQRGRKTRHFVIGPSGAPLE